MSQFSADIGRPNLSINASNANAAGDEWALPHRPGMVGVVTLNVKLDAGSYTDLDVALQGAVKNPPVDADFVTLANMTDNAGGTVSADISGFRWFRAKKIAGTAAGGATLTAHLGFN